MISLCAEVYAGAGKAKDLTLEDVGDPKVGEFLSDIEKGVVHYGSSTGFFGRKMFERGPQFLSAAVMYENMVVESYGGVGGVTDANYSLPFPVVAIYPSEGDVLERPPGRRGQPRVGDARAGGGGEALRRLPVAARAAAGGLVVRLPPRRPICAAGVAGGRRARCRPGRAADDAGRAAGAGRDERDRALEARTKSTRTSPWCWTRAGR